MPSRRPHRGSQPTHFRARRFDVNSPGGRLITLLTLAAVAGVAVGLVLPHVSPTVGQITGLYTASGPAADALAALAVDDAPSTAGYDRDLFGYRQTDDDGNGCDIREDILARDLTDVTYRSAGGCQVQSGTLDDPYTGQTIRFERGRDTSSAVQIDHVVALENAWQSGARDWDAATRMRFGNDPANLLAVDGPANQDKGSASAAYWLPTNADYRCEYVARQIGVKTAYGLTVTTAERRAMQAVLRACPAQELS
ncbi:HNH endonuclease family protein [Bifidobacterium amazonense]|uniref:HNH endonuclease family protein n=1 Tax=Bifidobacterium amazonense TaxID=2809027 RepID=A0ABS9VTF7_9BIFI|nr:HNH endonuclease family protein [Bifidobacterium amazonense]MCH9275382.1 HNH endonuclease family protein [Bifidobacterium amazonense]